LVLASSWLFCQMIRLPLDLPFEIIQRSWNIHN
jgi:hypothetical protein